MELKNSHPEERKSSGKVWGYIVSGLRSIVRPKKNTKWDYLVPLSLVGLQFWMFNYPITHYEIYDPSKSVYDVVEESLWEIKDILFAEFSYAVFIILVTFFLTRVQRLVVLPGLISILLATVAILKGGTIEQALGLALFSIPLHIFFILSTVSLLIKFGNNSKERISKKSTPIRSAIAWGVYGFGFQILPLTVAPMMLFGGQAGVQFKFPPLLDRIYDLLDPIMQKLSNINPILGMAFYILFFPILFALIGYSIEKYKQKKEAKTK